MDTYDEDIQQNRFFNILKNDYEQVFHKAVTEGWIICIPRAGAIPKHPLTQDDFLAHILLASDELPETHFRSLTDKSVTLKDSLLILETDTCDYKHVQILFDETFYDEENVKYKIYCLEKPLIFDVSQSAEPSADIINLDSLRDCVDFIWSEFSGGFILQRFDVLVQHFMLKRPYLETESLKTLRDISYQLYSEAVHLSLSDRKASSKAKEDPYFLELLKLSVESYILHNIYTKLIKGITACTACDDSLLNRKIRNLSDLHLRDLDITPELSSGLTISKLELSHFSDHTTPLGKLQCLKRSLSSIDFKDKQPVSTDDILPILVFLVVKSNVANWYANLAFLKLFRFSSTKSFNSEHSFNISSLEAAMEHIQSGVMFSSLSPEADCMLQPNVTRSPIFKTMEESIGLKGDDPLTTLFEYARLGKVDEIKKLFKTKPTIDAAQEEEPKTVKASQAEIESLLCHPLCSCDKCESIIKTNKKEPVPSVSSRDNRGYSALHIACIFGKPNVVDYLINEGADVEMIDFRGATPLHCAAQRGHQNALLLLLHAGTDINKKDNDSNTALHLASQNGHDGCVKALLFYSESVECDLEMNAQNLNGDTPLHLACRWGFSSIVQLLLERIITVGLSLKILNNRKLTPIECAHNIHISRMILNAKDKNNTNVMVNKFVRVGFDDGSSQKAFNSEYEQYGARNLFRPSYGEKSKLEVKQIEKLSKAVAVGDTKLVCYYLGIDEELCYSSSEEVAPTPRDLCHPLCQCPACCPNSNKPKDCSNSVLINGYNKEGLCALHVAAMKENSYMCKILIKQGANANQQSKDKGETALHMASQKRNLDVMEALLKDKVQPDIVDAFGNTALHYCCTNGYVEGVELLLKYNAAKDISNRSDRTPAEEAEFSGHWNIVESILGKGF